MSTCIKRADLEAWILSESASLDTEPDRQYVVERLREELPAAFPICPGDPVFYVMSDRAERAYHIMEDVCFAVMQTGFIIDGWFLNGLKNTIGTYVPFSDLGSRVFLTKEAAAASFRKKGPAYL